MKKVAIGLLFPLLWIVQKEEPNQWIRINQLGYTPRGVKVGVWCSKDLSIISHWQLLDASTDKVVYSAVTGKAYGSYGPFRQTYRLDFSSFKKPGRYYLVAGNTHSPVFNIAEDVYAGAADFCLRYMRQQRSGFNPFLRDSCHTHDGYVLYGKEAGIADSSHIDVVGGWHDASDYLQYSSTSANATYHLLMAYRDFPSVFPDSRMANGLNGKNGVPDVLDEARWGLDWLLKMHPRADWMFNQVGDDRDHQGMRIPKEDSFYGKGFERPVYFLSGEPQQRGKFMNSTTGTSSTAGKFASAFALGSQIFEKRNAVYASQLYQKALSAYSYGEKKLGFSQTASVRSPYIYAEANWTDDMELAATNIGIAYRERNPIEKRPKRFIDDPQWISYFREANKYSFEEPVTPWLGADTAAHYQWYPFINLGHYELAKQMKGINRARITGYYKSGIQKVWNKAKQNAFYRGIPFIWCSNNLTVSFAIQCFWYQELSGDRSFEALEQSCFDWLFGCNPWGTSMVYGLPAYGDTPVDPHSAFTHLGNYPIDGGLVDGPVYGSIYKSLIGITLSHPDSYAAFQSNLAVYHDDYGDYSTNEPTMDGTASLIYLLAAKENRKSTNSNFLYDHGAIVRGDSTKKTIALVFTGDEFADGGHFIDSILQNQKINASFFFTGRFYKNPVFKNIIHQLRENGNYLGAHSNNHLLYCDWNNRDSLLVTKEEFVNDLLGNYHAMEKSGITKQQARFFLPPFEWFNDSIAFWTKGMGLQLVNFSPGTTSNADYTTPEDRNYRSSELIYDNIIHYEQGHPGRLNGYLLLLHIGTDPKRTDKFYWKLPGLIKYLKSQGYHFQTITGLLESK